MGFSRRRGRFAARCVIAVLPVAGAQGCGGHTAPEPAADARIGGAAEVRIELAVSGGIAGTEWAVTIDGARGVVVGDRCRGPVGCDWADGETLATVDEEALLALARRFAAEGFFDLERTDYGSQCCDQFDYALGYSDAERGRTVRGSDGTLPASVMRLVGAVRSFVDEARGP